MSKKYYWWKMPRNFFSRHDVKMVKSVLGAEALLCYIHLVTECIDHDGMLRFSDEIPYSVTSLSYALDVNSELLSKLFDLLKEYKLIDIFEDGTIYIPFIAGRIGSDSDSAERVRKYRERKKSVTCNGHVTELKQPVTPCNTEIEIEIDKDIDSKDIRPMSTPLVKKKRSPKPKPVFAEDSEPYKLSLFLLSMMLTNNPKTKKPNLQSWSKDMDLILRVDHRSFDDVNQIIIKCQTDSFWHKQILSPSNLRDKFDRLTLLDSQLYKKMDKYKGMEIYRDYPQHNYTEKDIEDLYYDPFKQK